MDDKRDIVLTTDAGKEFAQAEEVVGSGVLKQKPPQSKNDIAVVDRAGRL